MKALALSALGLLLAACTSSSSSSDGSGSNTNWLTCEQSSECPGAEICVSQKCTPVDSDPCADGAVVTLESSTSVLEARQGSFFADALYEPVVFDEEPLDWVDPVTIAMLTARVTSPSGEPVPDCELSWFTHEGSGWLFPDASTSDAAGEVHARWIAGLAETETVSVALRDESNHATSAEMAGHALPHDPATAEVMMPYVSAPLSEGASALRVRLQPLAAPARSFFATALPDFFTGLQNTSDSDAFASDVAAENLILIASVWNRAEGDAELLWADADVSCGPHDQDLGGIRCDLLGAWHPGDTRDVIVEFRSLATDEVAPAEYAALGYAELTCASPAGCTDYSVFIADAGGEPRRLAALRIQSGAAPSAFSSYIDAYGESTATSCLATPLYQASFAMDERVGADYQPINGVTYDASYALWANQICANHGAFAENGAFTLYTGGDDLIVRPALPGDPPQTLTLP